MRPSRFVLYQRTVLMKLRRPSILRRRSMPVSRTYDIPKIRVVTVVVAVHDVADERLIAVPGRGRLFRIVEHYV
jgi:hypothetical protein